MPITYYFTFALIRVVTFPLRFVPYSFIHRLGNKLGSLAYYLLPKFRKRALSNLALADDLALKETDLIKIAKESFQNLMITCLEYSKLAQEKNIHRIATCQNPEMADQIMKEGKSIIFFCGHQANWEILFLEGTSRMPGVAIGRPVKNPLLYRFVLSMRQKFGGKIITPKNAVWEGLRALKRGCFLGIVGDQGMPDSGFSSPFFGRRAWTSPLPALLAYRTGSPIIVASTLRQNGKYWIHYSDPIWPDSGEPQEKEIDRMMKEALTLLETSIKKEPGQWMWQHNRWKQQTPDKLLRPFRQESLCLILPSDPKLFQEIFAHLPTFREIYPYEFITVMMPKIFQDLPPPIEAEYRFYSSLEELLIPDYRFKLLFNFSDRQEVNAHFLNLSVFTVVTLDDLKKRGVPSDNLSTLLKKALYAV